MDGVVFKRLRRITTDGGDVLHAMKASDPEYCGFGEAYFSIVKSGAVKGWKRHRTMTLNLVVPVGAVRFVIHDDRPGSATQGENMEYTLSAEGDFGRLTVAPGLWFAFQGVSDTDSLVFNLADIPHDPDEVDRGDLGQIPYGW